MFKEKQRVPLMGFKLITDRLRVILKPLMCVLIRLFGIVGVWFLLFYAVSYRDTLHSHRSMFTFILILQDCFRVFHW